MVGHLRAVPDTGLAPLRALIYARTSHDPTGRGRSTESQVDACRRDAEDAGWTVAQVVIDDDRSASTHARKAREGWHEVVAAIERGDVDILVTWEWSRATRDLRVYVELERMLQARGVLLAYQGTVYDLRKAGDRRRVAGDAVEAQYEADRTSERVLREKARSAVLGLPSGPTPYGYRRVYDTRSGVLLRQEPDTPSNGSSGTAGIVRELVDRFLAGASLNQLAIDMTSRGIATPKPPRKVNGARGWTAATVGQVLRSPSIAGLRQHTRDGERTYHPAAWSPVITLEERERILAILSDPRRVIHRGVEPVHLLSHIAVCGLCGTPVRHRMKHQKGVMYPAYTCDRTGCRGVYVQAQPADDVVTAAVLTVMSNPASLPLLRGDGAQEVAARRAAEVRIHDLESELEELQTAYRSKAIRATAYATALGPLEDQLAEARAATAPRSAGRPVLDLAAASDVGVHWADMTIADQRSVIRSLFEIRLHPATVKGQRRWDPRRVELIPLARLTTSR